MNVRDVACMKPAARAWARPGARTYSRAGIPHYQQRDQEDRHEKYRPGAAEKALMSRPAPVLTKNTGIRNPKPIASSLPVSTSGRPATAGPAHDDPGQERAQDQWPARSARPPPRRPGRSDGQPDPQLGAGVLQPVHHLSQRTPSLTRWVTTTTTAVKPTNAARSPSSTDGFADDAEKNTDSRTSGPSSASEPAAMIRRPNWVSVSPTSLSTGTSTPRDVDIIMMATRRPSFMTGELEP